MLRILYRHYGGVDWFDDKPISLISDCLSCGINKELEIPKLIKRLYDEFTGQPIFNEKKNMKTREEIMKEYGLEVD